MSWNFKILFFVTVLVIVIAGLKLWQLKTMSKLQTREDFLRLCVEHTGVSYHIHPQIKIFVDEKPFMIPSGIGIEPGCMRVIHTHDDLPKVHIESPRPFDFTLEDFFVIWNKPFQEDRILDYSFEDGYVFRFFEDGKEVYDPQNIVLKDNAVVEIKITRKVYKNLD